MAMKKIKHRDSFPISLKTNHDLTGVGTRLVVRHLSKTGEAEDLEHTVTDATTGAVSFVLDGTWEVGRHFLELKLTQGTELRTAPSVGFLEISIVPDLAPN